MVGITEMFPTRLFFSRTFWNFQRPGFVSTAQGKEKDSSHLLISQFWTEPPLYAQFLQCPSLQFPLQITFFFVTRHWRLHTQALKIASLYSQYLTLCSVSLLKITYSNLLLSPENAFTANGKKLYMELRKATFLSLLKEIKFSLFPIKKFPIIS